ncbi:MAG: EamA family transporter [Betaproteobacteria bacterium]|nr:MAG: EamA family transporter [Betaproteobacteria bacterium]
MISTRTLPIAAALAALINASVWGISWFPLKWLEARGVGSLWTTLIVFAACTLVVLIARPSSLRSLLAAPVLLWLAFAAGMTNACFNISLATGDVVRVVLLFYLMPMWVVVLARWMLNEPITIGALTRVVLALVGAALVLGEGKLVLPIPQSAADWLAIAGGFFFGLNNVLLRKYAHEPDDARALAMFSGAVMISPLVLALLWAIDKPMNFSPQPIAWLGLLLFAVAVLIGNLALQYGAARLRANVLSVLMLAEILVATLSAWLLGAAQISQATLIGGAFIIAASLLAVFSGTSKHDS